MLVVHLIAQHCLCLLAIMQLKGHIGLLYVLLHSFLSYGCADGYCAAVAAVTLKAAIIIIRIIIRIITTTTVIIIIIIITTIIVITTIITFSSS